MVIDMKNVKYNMQLPKDWREFLRHKAFTEYTDTSKLIMTAIEYVYNKEKGNYERERLSE